MERKDFLKNGLRLLGATTLVPVFGSCNKDGLGEENTGTVDGGSSANSCVVTDSETDGPYPLYNSRGSSANRIDIRDGKSGLQLEISIVVKNVSDNCNALANARVDIWHCDKDGYYSGYTNTGYLGTQNNSSQVFCRGLQYTDSNGEVKFTSIYPGWYNGRVTHIHAQVYVNNVLKLTTQIAFPEDINTEVYNTNLYLAHGQNPTKNTSDSIIKDSLDNELASVTANSTTGGYNLTHTIFVAV